MDIIKAMQEYYDKRASVYDSSMKYTDPEEVKKLSPAINFIIEYLRDRNILEIACGPGFWTYWVSHTAASITATDYNQSVIDFARLKDFNFSKVKFLTADAFELDGINDSFNGALAVDWLAHVPKSLMQTFLSNFHKKMVNGSKIIFCDQTPGAHSITSIYDNEGNHIQERTLPDTSKFKVIKNFFSDDELRTMFSKYTKKPEIVAFPECRRKILYYIYQA